MRSSGCGGRFFTILKQRWDFYRFSPSLRRAVLLPFYVKSAELLHYPHPTCVKYCVEPTYGFRVALAASTSSTPPRGTPRYTVVLLRLLLRLLLRMLLVQCDLVHLFGLGLGLVFGVGLALGFNATWNTC